MAAQNFNSPKAFKFLFIRPEMPRNKQAHLLGLPQELRDAIYEMVLVESPLHLRQHEEGCQRIDVLHGAETPVCMSTLEVLDRGHGRREDRYKFEACERICQGRSGLTLLRVNKQIYCEAHPLFLSRNMFCFVLVQTFNGSLEGMLQSSLRVVRRLNVFNNTGSQFPLWQPSIVRVDDEKTLWDNIQLLKHLVDLCLPAFILIWQYNGDLVRLKSLRTLGAA